ncbi:HAD family hydrolase [Sporomusa acidovorans]|uniref:Phosphorylated carbohydrates phosphatase n=1 Tax=Sporomusa acidovorans (strain ATCC 49682 / DSM 3132 / Mol) TaxID=1123286 RepID=A0ABZ3J9R3_SPOA4|nr:HAD family phosphatase [Sporomusa acidovorans]OZC15149.1 phosphorylated carbohydrates phosphatase [Sporomusa acidovorans DSM 3132]SDF43847.1 haloacid dehalogenase superfamily, subfamily IA, variant 3 with third motif having DD or ED/haloacid dehalogenase superfamily, subfamily IA, variant 1 with third motif having Dx(3-4)D or Dx(3-4)E [Sporomusa acidovorans]
MIKAIIFDMDGVLIDAREWHYIALNRALQLFGFEISRYEHLVTFDGLPTRVKLEMLSIEKKLPRKLHSFINLIKQQYTMELIHTYCKPVFYHQYALAKLKLQGYHLAVCSNSILATVQTMLNKAKLEEYFDFYLSNEDVSNPKPSPEIYLKAIERLTLLPEECLIVEDNENGIKAALDSGAHVMKVGNVEEVTYCNIIRRIKEVKEQGV